MAFQFVEPDKYEFIDEEGESFVVAYIGSGANTDRAYYAAAALSPYDDHMEYSFFIIQRCNGQERLFTSGLETKDIFKGADRLAILMVVLTATEYLLDQNQPPLVDRCTTDANLTGEALVKHNLVSTTFRRCGYKITPCGDWNGKLVWKAERVAEGLH